MDRRHNQQWLWGSQGVKAEWGSQLSPLSINPSSRAIGGTVWGKAEFTLGCEFSKHPAARLLLMRSFGGKEAGWGFRELLWRLWGLPRNGLPRKSEFAIVCLGMLSLFALSVHCCHEELAFYPVCCWLFPAPLDWIGWKGSWHLALVWSPMFPHSAQRGPWAWFGWQQGRWPWRKGLRGINGLSLAVRGKKGELAALCEWLRQDSLARCEGPFPHCVFSTRRWFRKGFGWLLQEI